MNYYKKYYLLTYLLIVAIFGQFFFPIIRLFGLGMRLGDIIVLSVLPFLFIYKPLIPKETIFRLYFIMILLFFTSMIYGYMFLSVDFSYRDLLEILRLSFPLMICLVFMNVSKEKIIYFLDNLLYYGSFIIIIIGLIQYFLPYSIGTWITSFYSNEHQLSAYSDFRYKRILLTGSDPNIGALIGLLFLGFNMVKFFITKKSIYLLTAIFLIILILLTGSRTGLIACMIFLFTILIIVKSKAEYKIMFFLLAFVSSFVIIPMVPYIYIGFKTFISGSNTSFLTRLDKIIDSYYLFMQSPVFGWGPAKAIHLTVVDAEWFLLLRRYGVVGVLSFLIFMGYNIVRFYKNRLVLYRKDIKAYSLAILLISYSISVFFIMLTNNFVSGYQTLLPYTILVFSVNFRLSEIKKGINCA
jgi:hypothetical protein